MNTSNNSKTVPDQPAGHGTALYYEEKLQSFWKKNRNTLVAACAAVLLVVAGRGIWEIFKIQREKSIQTAYAAAVTPESLRTFIREHPGHRLAGVASLRLADDEYSSAKYTEALADYGAAAEALRGTPFDGRARLGQAVCKVRSGMAADGETQLKQLASDLTQLTTVRAESAYFLASIAADRGRTDDAKKYADQVQQIEPQGIWAQRALSLSASLASPSAPPSISLPTAGVRLPGPGK